MIDSIVDFIWDIRIVLVLGWMCAGLYATWRAWRLERAFDSLVSDYVKAVSMIENPKIINTDPGEAVGLRELRDRVDRESINKKRGNDEEG